MDVWIFLKIEYSNFFEGRQINAEYRQPFGSAALMKEAEGAKTKKPPLARGLPYNGRDGGIRTPFQLRLPKAEACFSDSTGIAFRMV